ncbi:MAG: hypothetical protein JW778_01845 [Candidatus Altiarchaeota archaeon]|nr:hypothetical protein [Candidatus Altiarchaeota archaeon]
MDKINWCLKKKEGISLVEPNPNLAEAYTKKAEESLQSMRINVIKDWEIATAYYTMYFSLYSILVRIGIKCEIHSCTVEFAKQYLKEFFKKEEIDFLKDSLKARIDAQYYVNRNIPDEQYNEMTEKAPEFLVKCKYTLQKLDENKINEIRNKLEKKITIEGKK